MTSPWRKSASHSADLDNNGHDAAANVTFDDTGLSITAADVQEMGEALDAAIAAGGIPASTVDAKGDLIVGTANDTVARLAVGANDTILMADSAQSTGLKYVASQTPSTQAFSDAAAEGTADTYARGDHKHGMMASPGGGISSGTSNPGSPTNGDLFYRSDLDLIIRYRSTGTRWVCTCPHTQNFSHQDQLTPSSVTHSVRAAYPVALTTQMLVESVSLAVVVNTTNNGTNYWTIGMPNGTVLNTSAIAANTLTKIPDTTQLAVNLSGPWADFAATKVLSPGSIFYSVAFTYRYIVT